MAFNLRVNNDNQDHSLDEKGFTYKSMPLRSDSKDHCCPTTLKTNRVAFQITNRLFILTKMFLIILSIFKFDEDEFRNSRNQPEVWAI